VPEIDRADIGAGVQVRGAPGVIVPIHRGDDAAHARLALAEILAQSQHAIVGGGLDRRAARAGDMLRHGIECADRQPPENAR